MKTTTLGRALSLLVIFGSTAAAFAGCSSDADGVIFKCTMVAACQGSDPQTKQLEDVCEPDSKSANDVGTEGSKTCVSTLADSGLACTCTVTCTKTTDACKQKK